MGETRSWEVEELHARLERDHGPTALRIVKAFEQRLDAEYSGSAVAIQWRGSRFRKDKFATLWPWIEYGRIVYYPPVCFRVDGRVEVPFWSMGGLTPRWNTYQDSKTVRIPFDEEEKRRELRDCLNGVPRINLKPGNPNGRSNFDLLLLEDRETFDKLVEVFDWYVNQIVEGSAKLPSNGVEARIKSDLDSLKTEETYFEGTKSKRFVNHYERSDKLRAETVKHHGVKCKVCGFDFEEVYGERGKDFIEAHHLVPVSSLGKETEVDPKSDMTVLCSNCHRMVHRRKDHVLTPEELRSLMGKRGGRV